MAGKVKDFSAFGKISDDAVRKLLEARLVRKNGEKADPKLVDKVLKVLKEGKLLKDVEEVVPYLRLHPPRHGFEGIKHSFKQGGSLGKRESMDDLLMRMM